MQSVNKTLGNDYCIEKNNHLLKQIIIRFYSKFYSSLNNSSFIVIHYNLILVPVIYSYE